MVTKKKTNNAFYTAVDIYKINYVWGMVARPVKQSLVQSQKKGRGQ
jgi:hypothetical protein